MTIPYTVASYVWVPRNTDVAANGDMTYMALAPGIPWQFFTDAPALKPPIPAGSANVQLPLPSWFPRKVLLTRITAVYGTLSPGTVELDVVVDPQGIAYKTSGPNLGEVGRDFTHQIQMLVWEAPNSPAGQQSLTNIMPVPVALDRDAGDKLTVYVGSSVNLTNIGVCFEWLVPNLIPL